MQTSAMEERLFLAILGTAVFLAGANPAAYGSPTAPPANVVRRSIESPIMTEVQAPRPTHTVEIFVTTWCPYCRSLESFLSAYKVPYTKYDVEHDSKGIEVYQQLGASGVPIIRIDGKKILRGFSPEDLKEALGLRAGDPELVVSALDIKHSTDLVER